VDQYLNNELLFLPECHVQVTPIHFLGEKPVWPRFSSKPFTFFFAARGFTWLTHDRVPQAGHFPSVRQHSAALWREPSPATWSKGPQQNEGKNGCHQASAAPSRHAQSHPTRDAPVLCISQLSPLSTLRDQTH